MRSGRRVQRAPYPSWMKPSHRDLAAAAAGGVVAALAVGSSFAVRGDRTFDVTATASSASGAISVEAEGHTYGIPLDVAWQDARGAFHESGRPECLPPSGKEEGPVRFLATAVDADGLKFRQVFFVECL